MSETGMAMMGSGSASGDDRAREAAEAAISSPLLEDANVQGARGVIINITGGPDLTLNEVSEASEIIHDAAHEDANIIFGAVVNPQMEGKVKITVIATGFDPVRTAMSPAVQSLMPTPVDLSAYTTSRAQVHEEERRVANGGSVIVVRRPSIDMPSVGSSASSGVGVAFGAATMNDAGAAIADIPEPMETGSRSLDFNLEGLDEPSHLDVPAFLRRKES
jgi:cell division protein FtsZ